MLNIEHARELALSNPSRWSKACRGSYSCRCVPLATRFYAITRSQLGQLCAQILGATALYVLSSSSIPAMEFLRLYAHA